MLLDVASLEDEVEIMNTLYLLHLSREGFVFILGVLDIHLADALAVYPIKTDFDTAAQHVARGRNLKLTCTLLEVNTLHEDILPSSTFVTTWFHLSFCAHSFLGCVFNP